MRDIAKETLDCIAWIQEWFAQKSGNAKGAVVGISGGKDSTVVAALLCRALGADNVLGVLMPNGEQPDISDSIEVCERLSMPYLTVNIQTAYEGILAEIPNLSRQTKTNVPPRLRMTVLYAIGQENGYRVAGTGNRSERHVGYCTKWGDTACDFNPVANFTSDEVIAIGRELGLPSELIEKPPSDGLSGLTDEENLGFSYQVLNRYIKTGEIDDLETKEKIDRRHAYNLHKTEPIPLYQPSNRLI